MNSKMTVRQKGYKIKLKIVITLFSCKVCQLASGLMNFELCEEWLYPGFSSRDRIDKEDWFLIESGIL